MQEITDSLLDFYDSSARDIIIELTGENIRIMPDFILPLAMITSEIIANTLEHAQQRANLIRLDISWSAKDDGEVSLMYGDVGGGFPEDVIQRLGESLGIMLIRTLAEQIHATISISNSDRGAITSIDFSSGSPQKK
jgi:two-component sensor histidine kinase